jgi:hypothetical protein
MSVAAIPETKSIDIDNCAAVGHLSQANQLRAWVEDPSRIDHWKSVFAECKRYGIESFDCTFIVFSETFLAQRSLENKLSRALKGAGLEFGPQAIELVAGWLVQLWWDQEKG